MDLNVFTRIGSAVVFVTASLGLQRGGRKNSATPAARPQRAVPAPTLNRIRRPALSRSRIGEASMRFRI